MNLKRYFVLNVLAILALFVVPSAFAATSGLPGMPPVLDSKNIYSADVADVLCDIGNTLTPIDPATGKFGKPIYVNDPYNLYFTPNGKYAVVMSEAAKKIVFRDPQTMAIKKEISSQCDGVNHADWSADGNTLVVSCEFSGTLNTGPMPQDVKLS